MGISAKPWMTPARAAPGNDRRAGVALAAVLFALVVVSILAAAMWTMTDLNRISTVNREQADRATLLAEAGAAHVLAVLRDQLKDTALTRLLRGSDGVSNTSDDGLLTGYGLSSDLQIPRSGVAITAGTYYVELSDDPGEVDNDPKSDSNFRILASCSGVTSDGGSSTIDVVIGGSSLPAISAGGDLSISGSPAIQGPCGGVHANDDLQISGDPIMQTAATASDQTTGDTSIEKVGGGTITPQGGQPPVDIPQLDPLEYCEGADYIARANGWFVTAGPPRDSVDANSVAQNGWKLVGSSPPVWDLSGNSTQAGTVCIEGNAKISGNPGLGVPGGIAMSIIATGSVEISGNPQIQPDHPDGALIVAGGDVKMNGNVTAATLLQDGLIYAGAQCDVGGNPTISGQMICRDDPAPPGSINHINTTSISGNPIFTYGCGGLGSGTRSVFAWYPRIGG